MVIWFIGLSGAGKSTLAKMIYKTLKKKEKNTVWIDGDNIRKIYSDKLGHTIKDREINAKRISKLSKFLSDQKINVIGSILSNFPKWQKWNKKNIKGYSQIFIEVPIEKLIKRDTKRLYKHALKKKIKNVIGIDMKFHKPINPDLIIRNDFKSSSKKKYQKTIINFIKNKYKIRI